ncbi:hypothetical protein [Azospirillum soli]|uniref:hypothetical protein n=1 Tax=Azospirillum soli TaxID=1304799 RepID=UPI001AE1FC25|nr:hypothetical protein [Azospirillum soli]MBP2315452.1 hypothetical protein [Azospirillum soli]
MSKSKIPNGVACIQVIGPGLTLWGPTTLPADQPAVVKRRAIFEEDQGHERVTETFLDPDGRVVLLTHHHVYGRGIQSFNNASQPPFSARGISYDTVWFARGIDCAWYEWRYETAPNRGAEPTVVDWVPADIDDIVNAFTCAGAPLEEIRGILREAARSQGRQHASAR